MSLRDKIERGSASIREGVQVVSSPDLFPTPPDVAARVAAHLELELGSTVLEPSAGTGALVRAVVQLEPTAWVVCVERDQRLAERLGPHARCADFLELEPGACWRDDLLVPDYYDRVAMNPPFSGGADIKHVMGAIDWLRPGGVLVAIVADGPRQERAFADFEDLERLSPGTFEGTNVRARIIRYRN